MKCQFRVLQHKILKNELVTTHVNETNIYLTSEMFLSSIGIVQVFIDVRNINFSISGIFTSVFHCLKDMDTYGIYLNNIII